MHGSTSVRLPALLVRPCPARKPSIEVLDPAARRVRLGEGQRARIEHIAIEIVDLDATLSALQALGILPSAPPRVSNCYLSVWTDSDTNGGVMYQFMQKA